MGRKVKQLKNYTTEQLESIFNHNKNNIVGFKLCAIIQLSRGYSSRKLEEYYRVSFKQICNWADRFDADGIAGLQIKSGRGRKSIISFSQKEQLKIDLQKSPENFGYNTGNWSGPLVKSHLKSAYFIAYSQSKVYKLMYDLGFSYQRPRAKYPERDEGKREIAKVDIKKL